MSNSRLHQETIQHTYARHQAEYSSRRNQPYQASASAVTPTSGRFGVLRVDLRLLVSRMSSLSPRLLAAMLLPEKPAPATLGDVRHGAREFAMLASRPPFPATSQPTTTGQPRQHAHAVQTIPATTHPHLRELAVCIFTSKMSTIMTACYPTARGVAAADCSRATPEVSFIPRKRRLAMGTRGQTP